MNDILKWLVHAVACGLAVTLLCTGADFVGMPVDGVRGLVVVTCQFISIAAFWCFVMAVLLVAGRWVAGTVMGLLMTAGGVLGYFRYTWHYSFDETMFDILGAVSETTTMSMINWQLVVWTITVVTIGEAVVFLGCRFYRLKYNDWKTWCIVAVASVASAAFLNPDWRMCRPLTRRIPLNVVYEYKKYRENRYEIEKKRERSDMVGMPMEDDVVVVVVIGEAVRSDNLGMNGYWRETTPFLEKRDGIVSFKNMWTDICYTNGSIPRIMTRADGKNPDRAYSERSFIDLFRQCGLPTVVITNQNIERQYSYFWNEADTLIVTNRGRDAYNYSKWLDEDVLEPYRTATGRMNEGLVVVHCIGSHWWYKAHYPDNMEYYRPVIKSRIVAECDSAAMVNTYDNTIRYMDWVVDQMISEIEGRKAILIYISDHGEALGEDGMWLHASDCRGAHRTAAFVWMSEKYREECPERWENFAKRSDEKMKTDEIYGWVRNMFISMN